LAIEANSYVVIRLQPNGRRSHPVYYVGLVIGASNNSWTIKIMKRRGSATHIFIYPSSEDVDIYSQESIMKVLISPKIVRNVYHFQEHQLEEFGSYLR
jgi:hypothetical protein